MNKFLFLMILISLSSLFQIRSGIVGFGDIRLDESALCRFEIKDELQWIDNNPELVYFAKVEKINKILCIKFDNCKYYMFDTSEDGKQILDSYKNKKNCRVSWYYCPRKK